MNTQRLSNLKQLFFENISTQQMIFKNTFWLFFGNTINKIFKFFLIVYAARVLGPTNYGVFIYSMSLVGTLFLFSDIGTNGLLVREYQKEGSDNAKLTSTMIVIRIALWLITAIISVSIFYFIQDVAVKSIFFWFFLLSSIQHFKEICTNLARANNKMQYEGLIIIVDTTLTTLLGLLLLKLTASIYILIMAYIIGAGGGLIAGVFVTYKYFASLKLFDSSYAKYILSIAWPFAFGSIISVVLLNTDILLLGILKDKTIVGQYSAGSKIINVLMLVPMLFSAALFPIFSKYHQEINKLSGILQTSLRYIITLGIPITVGGLLVAPNLLLKFYGDQYMNGIFSFQILLLMIPFMFVTIVLDHVLFATNYQIRNMIFTAIAATINLILDIALIPSYSLQGAAMATVIAQIINFALTFRLVKIVLKENFIPLDSVYKSIISTTIMGAVIVITLQLKMPILPILILATLLYFTVLLSIEKNLREMVFGVIKSIRVQD